MEKAKQIEIGQSRSYINKNGNKVQITRVSHKFGSCSIPDWCWNYIQPIKSTANHWDLKNNCVVCV